MCFFIPWQKNIPKQIFGDDQNREFISAQKILAEYFLHFIILLLGSKDSTSINLVTNNLIQAINIWEKITKFYVQIVKLLTKCVQMSK